LYENRRSVTWLMFGIGIPLFISSLFEKQKNKNKINSFDLFNKPAFWLVIPILIIISFIIFSLLNVRMIRSIVRIIIIINELKIWLLENVKSAEVQRTFLGFLLAIITAVIGKIVYDRIRAPKLIAYVKEEPYVQELSNNQARGFYRIAIKNKQNILGKLPANKCRVKITFKDNLGKTMFSLAGKWDWTPEPLKYKLVNGQLKGIPDPTLIPPSEFVDINPNDEESFCILMKYDGENECYAFNGFSYLHPDLKNPNWKLGLGEYQIHLELHASNSHKKFTFTLKNEGKKLSDISIIKRG